jgi:hypothetical protein
MRCAVVALLTPVALAACTVSSTGTAPQTTRAGASGGAPSAPSSQTPTASPHAPAPDAATASPTDSGTVTGKGQVSPGQTTPTAGPTVQPAPPPTAPPTVKPLFNDNDADNVNGGFVPANSDGDGQG